MKTSLALRQGMALTMTPALQQAIRLLQLSTLDLQLEIQQALESNLLLERDDSPEPALDEAPGSEPVAEAEAEDAPMLEEVVAAETLSEELPVDAAWDEVYDDYSPAAAAAPDDDLQDFLQANLRGSTGLREHLLAQAEVAPFVGPQAQIAEHLIDAVNEDGYLEDWPGLLARLTAMPGVTPAAVEAVLELVQDFDPPGVAARDLAECLRLQLESLRPGTPGRLLALRIVEGGHLLMLARRDEAGLRKALAVEASALRPALALIRSLQPHPGRPFQAHESDYLSPDVIVSRRNGRWRVALNPENQPRLRINSRYQGFIKRADTSKDQLALKQHLQEARYFINSLEARNDTILRVAQCIVEEQRAFLDYGEEAMRPLVLRDVAEQLGIHESTVSRATANKYMLTPRGLYELKYFFSSHVQTTQGGMASATAIQAMIKRLIHTEDPGRPLSDSTLAELLLKDGIQVARRTVAKYREALNIPPSHERRAVA
ncbi:MAG TPA: RNA polymerase factor sigma-54 [Nevskiaceae bacterium]|nr:RNA polymerase factor sigma-54 [Nevskiaceae bacterium]